VAVIVGVAAAGLAFELVRFFVLLSFWPVFNKFFICVKKNHPTISAKNSIQPISVSLFFIMFLVAIATAYSNLSGQK